MIEITPAARRTIAGRLDLEDRVFKHPVPLLSALGEALDHPLTRSLVGISNKRRSSLDCDGHYKPSTLLLAAGQLYP